MLKNWRPKNLCFIEAPGAEGGGTPSETATGAAGENDAKQPTIDDAAKQAYQDVEKTLWHTKNAEQADTTHQVEELTKQVAGLTEQAALHALAAVRFQIALEYGLSVDDAKYLTGDAEQMKALAERLAALPKTPEPKVKPTGPVDPAQGKTKPSAPKNPLANLAAAIFGDDN